MQKKKRYWPDPSVRSKRWRAKQGKAVLTYLHPCMVKALHEEAKRKNKAVWLRFGAAFPTGFRKRREEAGRLESAQKLVSKEQGNPLQGSSICLTNRVLTS